MQYEGLTYITVRGAGVPLVQVVPQGRTHAGRGKFYFRHRQLISAQGNWSVKDVHIFLQEKMTSSFLVRRRLPSTEQGSTACGGVARVFDGDDSTWLSLNVFMNKRLKAVEMYVENSILFLSEKL